MGLTLCFHHRKCEFLTQGLGQGAGFVIVLNTLHAHLWCSIVTYIVYLQCTLIAGDGHGHWIKWIHILH